MNCLFFTIVALALSGCVGGAVQHNERVNFETPQISPDGSVRSGSILAALSRADVEQVWGPPTRIKRISDSEERWTYRSDELRWMGIELVALLPLPLIVPVGHESVTLTIKDDNVTRAEVLKQDESHALFGLKAGPCGFTWRFCDFGRDSNRRESEMRLVNPTWLERPKKD